MVVFGVQKNEGTEGRKIYSQEIVGLTPKICFTHGYPSRDCGKIRDRKTASVGKIQNFKVRKGRFLG